MCLRLLKTSIDSKFFPLVPIIDTIPLSLFWWLGDMLGCQGRSISVMRPGDYGGISNYLTIIAIVSFLFLYLARIFGFNINIIGRRLARKIIYCIENKAKSRGAKRTFLRNRSK
jgi:hypothetical protein